LLLGINRGNEIVFGVGVVGVMEKINELGSSELFGRETKTSELADEMVASRIEGKGSLFTDVVKVEGWFLRSFGKGIKTFGGETKFIGTERDDDVEFFLKNLVFFNQAFDELTVVDDGFFDFLRRGGLDVLIKAIEVISDIFSLGTNEDLNREREGVKKSSIGIDGGILFFFRK